MGTASAKPGKLEGFVSAAATIRGELSGRITTLRASYDSFQTSGSAGVANPDLMGVELPGLLTNYSNDEVFVEMVRRAFVNADAHIGADGVASVPDASFTSSFEAVARAAGIDPNVLLAGRDPVTVDAPVAAGIPRTSGFVADPVCTATGHFVEAEEDFSWPDRLSVLRWRRVYSSRFVASGPFGRGWASWASVALVVEPDGTVGFQGPDGQMVVFPLLGGVFPKVAGVSAELAALPEGGWSLSWDAVSDHPGAVWIFDPEGQLTEVSSPTTGTTVFERTGGLVTALQHEGGRRLELVWNIPGNGGGGARIIEVRSSCGRVARYRYNAAGDLTRTERVLGDQTYVPDGRGMVVEVVDADGVRLCRNVFDDEGRVLTQISPFGRETVFRYHPGNRTVVSDTTDGPVAVYEHDHVGRLVGLTDHMGHQMRRSFDVEGRCVEATGFDGGNTRHSFAADGSTASLMSPDGVEQRWDYDDERRVTSHQIDGGPTLDFTYDGDEAFPSAMTGPDGWSMQFELIDGLLKAITDADGVGVRYDHDADGNVIRTINGVGAVTTMEPHVSGEAGRVTMPDGAVFECDRDDAGRLRTIRTPLGEEFHVEWTPAGRMTAMVEPNGARTSFEHGTHGAVERLVDALGAAVELQHDHLERVVGMTAPGDAKWDFSYTALGLLSLVEDPAGGTWSYDYDAEGRLVAATDPLGAQVQNRFNPAGRLVEQLDRSGQATRFAHDTLGRVVQSQDPEGAATTTEYDIWGRRSVVRRPDGDSVTYSYTSAGRIKSLTTSAGRGWTVEHDLAGRLATVTDAAGGTTRFEWDVCDRVTAIVSPSGRTERREYDAVGRQVTSERGGRHWRNEYDHNGRVTAATDPLGATARYEYDLRGKLVAATDKLGNTLRIRYDERGNATGVLDPFGRLVTTTYDAMRRGIATTDQLGRTTRWARDGAGRVVRQELPTGDVVEWDLDPNGRARGVRMAGRDVVVFDRDRAGRPVLVHEPARNRTISLAWTRGGRLREFDVDGRTMSWDRDDDGLVRTRHDPLGGTTRFERDVAGRLASVELTGWGRVDLDRDADGRFVAVRAPGFERRWDHDAGGLVIRSQAAGPDGAHATELRRDGAGRVAEARSGDAVTRFAYDAAGQLVGASGPAGAWTWAYDPAGRLAAEDGPAGARRFAYDEAHQLLHVDAPAGRTTFAYDAAGRRLDEAGPARRRTYGWDGLGRLTRVDIDGEHHDVDVDALGRLASYDDTRFTWDPTGTVPELLAVDRSRVVGSPGIPLGVLEDDGADAGTTWLPGDGRTPAAHLAGGEDPWGIGAVLSLTDSVGLGRAGQLDLDGLTWLHNRLYDDATRQFLSPDPLPGVPGAPVAAHPYHYANNDPIGFVDPLGLQPLSIDQYNDLREQETGVQWGTIAIIGLSVAACFIPGGPLVAMAIGAGMGMAPGIIQGVTTGEWDWGGMAKGAIVGAIAGRVGFSFGGQSATLLGAVGRGSAGGAATGVVGQTYDVLPLPGSDGQFNVEDVALETVIGGVTGGMAHRSPTPHPTGAGDPPPSQTVYRFYDESNPNTLLPRLSSASPDVQAAERLALQDPAYASWRANAHMEGTVHNSPFVSVIDDPMGAVNSTDPWLRTIATGQPGDPSAAQAPSLGRFEVPSDRLIAPPATNALSIAEGERLFLGDDLSSYHVETIPNPYPSGTPNWTD